MLSAILVPHFYYFIVIFFDKVQRRGYFFLLQAGIGDYLYFWLDLYFGGIVALDNVQMYRQMVARKEITPQS